MNNTNIPTTKNTKLNLRLRERGMSLRLLSRVSGVAYATVYNLFTGKKSICDASAGTVRKLSAALDMSMDDLYDEMQNQAGNSGGGVDPAPIRDFTLMWRDEIIADLMISDGKVLIERYSTSPAKQIFHANQMTLFTLGEILRTRCWDENREDIGNLLELIGLDEYNPYAIVSKTHGLMAQDPIWFRFKGEKLTYREVRRLNIVTENHNR